MGRLLPAPRHRPLGLPRRRVHHRVRVHRRLGSAALDLCYVGCGRADAYVEEGLNDWDLAAGGLVVEEAGGTLAQREGVGGKRCVVAAPAGGFDDFLAAVEDCGFLAS